MVSDQIYQLIIGRLSRQETLQEAWQLDEWLSQNPGNRKIFDEYRRLWIQTQQLYQSKEPDTSRLFQRFEDHCYHQRKSVKWLRYAAVIAIPLALTLGVFFSSRQAAIQPTSENHQARQNKVQLLLSNGQKLVLADEQTTEIPGTEGVRINQKGNTLKYVQDININPVNEAVEYNTLIIPRGAEYSLQLSDGSKIHLNSESELTYPARFSRQERKVFLKGEAYFDVSQDTARPFIVSVRQLNIQVLGTAFNVMAYADVPQIETTLERGCVRVNNQDKGVVLHPGMQATFSEATASFTLHEVDTRLYTSWKEDKMIFEDMRMEELLQKLGRWYDFNVFYLNPHIKDIRLTGHISRHDNITSMLELLETMGKVRFTVHNKTITVSENAK